MKTAVATAPRKTIGTLLAAAALALAAAFAAAPAHAAPGHGDWGKHRHGWMPPGQAKKMHRRDHEPAHVYAPPPPAVVYVPRPVYYAPPPQPGITIVVPLHFD